MFICSAWFLDIRISTCFLVVILLASHVQSAGIYTASDSVLRGRVSGHARLTFY